MEDEKIIGLFWERSEEGIARMKTKYGSRSMAVAMNVLGNVQDAEECVNDALNALWNRIPPERPQHLWAYFSRIVRNLSCTRLDYLSAAKRNAESEVCLHELEGCLASREDPESALEAKQIAAAINTFLDGLENDDRILFVRRYYYFDSCEQIGKRLGLRRGAVNTRLWRLRTMLRKVLEKEEICI